MPMLNNENVLVNDRVYDLTQGYGTVVDTAFNEIAVRFDNGTRIAFDSTGHYAGTRRLYWHNPVVIEPTKDNALWEMLKACLSSIHSYVKR